MYNPVKVDELGNAVGHSNWPINPAGFTFHSENHRTLPNVHCVTYIHTMLTMAGACRGGRAHRRQRWQPANAAAAQPRAGVMGHRLAKPCVR